MTSRNIPINNSTGKTRSFLCFLCFFSGIVFFTSGCVSNQRMTAAELAGLPGIAIPAEHIVFIGFDGWAGAYLEKANMPTVKRMIATGASSLDMRCIIPSISWPNWSTLFSGTPPEHRNGETTNYPAGVMDFTTIFAIVHNTNKTNVFFHEWGTLGNICPDEEVKKINITSNIESAQTIANYIIQNKPVFTAVAFNEPDNTGHKNRWGSSAYYAKLAELDNLIAIIEQGVKDAGIYDSTVFVFSADHGGDFLWGHGGNLKKHRQIPIVIYGRGIKNGFTIPSPLSITDIAPTIAEIFGLAIPPEWTGRPLKEIFY